MRFWSYFWIYRGKISMTPEHLDFHGTMDAYADAKAELFRRSALAVVNTDSPYGERMRRAAAGRCVTCSAVGRPADYRAENLRLASVRGVEYELHSGNTRMKISCPIPGGFTVMNSMQAAACAIELGIAVKRD